MNLVTNASILVIIARIGSRILINLEVMSEFKKKYLGLLQSTMAMVKLVIMINDLSKAERKRRKWQGEVDDYNSTI